MREAIPKDSSIVNMSTRERDKVRGSKIRFAPHHGRHGLYPSHSHQPLMQGGR